MTDFEKKPKGKIRCYCCGGAGTNIGSLLEIEKTDSKIGMGELDIVYMDTSLSNHKMHINKTNAYLIGELDGSGKVRSENHEEINNRVRAILQQFKPADLNIVISSAGGGSGSVFSPLITRELLDNDVPTIVLIIGSADTKLDTENTLKTLKSFEAIAKRLNKPVVMAYAQNSQTTNRAEVDKIMYNIVLGLVVLFSREHKELDTKDLFNWLNFNKVTSYPVQLASLTILNTIEPIPELGSIVSVATLAVDGSSTAMLEMPEYQCVGFLPDGMDPIIVSKVPVNFIISDGVIPSAAKHLQKILDGLEKQQAARIKRSGVVNDSDKVIDSGLVL